MDIITKFNNGDKVHFMYDNKPTCQSISGVKTFIGKDFPRTPQVAMVESKTMQINYCFGVDVSSGGFSIHENLCFASQDELMKSLFEEHVVEKK